jgi:hypothetical protein
MYAPATFRPFTFVVLEVVLSKVTVVPLGELTTLQTPVPTAGAVAAKACVLLQIEVEAVVMTETLGLAKRLMVIVLTLGVQVPLLIVQVKVVVPTDKLLTPLVAELALLNATPASLLVHVPAPTLGTLPDKIEVVPHIVWSLPAIEVLGLASLVIVTVLSLDGHVPLEIVHLNT